MKMVPPAGVEPATYRLGGGFSKDHSSADLQGIVATAHPKRLDVHPGHNQLIPQGSVLDFGRHSSVLTERRAHGAAASQQIYISTHCLLRVEMVRSFAIHSRQCLLMEPNN